MTPIRQWPIRHRLWRMGLSGGVSGAGLPAIDTLSLDDSGAWRLASHGAGRPLHLFHVWQAFAWITMRLRDGAAPEAAPVQLTVWKFGLASRAWRELCICVARQAAMPERGASKKENP
ncbi:MAG: hypothetical protein WBA83_00635 [Burkholderiaceae bacterium]